MELDSVHYTDLLTLCGMCDPQSVDMILCDLPYGVTANDWDKPIPFAPMWEAFNRVIKPHGAIVLTATMPFGAALIMSNLKCYRHRWVWDKDNSAGFVLAKKRPFQIIEDIFVFSIEEANYYPIMTQRGKPVEKRGGTTAASANYKTSLKVQDKSRVNNVYYPKCILRIPSVTQTGKLHRTQKPVPLFEYLIRTYTQEGEIVLDPCVGSGTTAIAARNANRRYIVGDNSEKYIEIARKRLASPYTPALF